MQLDYLEARGTTAPHVREIIERHLAQLGEHKFGPRIAQELHIPSAEVTGRRAVHQEAPQPLPRPGHPHEPAGPPGYVLPDVIIAKQDKGFEVDVVESKRFFLRINPLYRELMLRAQQEEAHLNDNEAASSSTSPGPACSWPTSTSAGRPCSASWYLVSFQGDYLANGVRHLRPLTRAMVAAELGVHESTVSRATASKYVMLPTGEVVP